MTTILPTVLTIVQQFMTAFEQRDRTTLASLLAERSSLVQPITFSGNDTPDFRAEGKEAVLAYLDNALSLFGTIQFVDPAFYIADNGTTVFVPTTGNMTTAQGLPYRNVYLFRLDIADGKIVHIDEYSNPVTFSQAFGAKLGK